MNRPFQSRGGENFALHAVMQPRHPSKARIYVVNTLLNKGANTNLRSSSYHLKNFSYKAGVNPSAHYKGRSSLLSAVEYGYVHLVRVLSAQHASPRECSALAIDAGARNIPIALLLLEASAKVCTNQTNSYIVYRDRDVH